MRHPLWISRNTVESFEPMKQSLDPRSERSHVFNFAAMTLGKAGDGKRKLRITRKSTYTQSARNLTLSESVSEGERAR